LRKSDRLGLLEKVMTVISTIEQLEANYGSPNDASTVKVADRVTPPYRVLEVAVRGAGDLRAGRARPDAADTRRDIRQHERQGRRRDV
jgi:hypothetical protein